MDRSEWSIVIDSIEPYMYRESYMYLYRVALLLSSLLIIHALITTACSFVGLQFRKNDVIFYQLCFMLIYGHIGCTCPSVWGRNGNPNSILSFSPFLGVFFIL